MKSLLISVWTFFCLKILSPIHWSFIVGWFNHGKYWKLSKQDWDMIRSLLKEENLVILCRRKTHLTTYTIALAELLRIGKVGYWSHSLMNLEGAVGEDKDFRLVESIATGVGWHPFEQIFDCDSVCIMRPRGYKQADWDAALVQARVDTGKPYDTLFEYQQDQKLSCVELVRDCLMKSPNYYTRLGQFEALVQKYKDVLPDMLYGCKDFEILLEIRR